MIPGLERSPGEGNGYPHQYSWGFPGFSDSKESACNEGSACRIFLKIGFDSESGRSPGGGNGYPTPVFLPGEFQRRLASYSSWGFKEPDMTEQLITLTYFLLLWSHRNHFSDEEEKVWRLGEGEERGISNS